MGLLWTVTLVWAFSFSLIGVYLSGQVDDHLSVLIRTGLAGLVFLPLMLRRWPGGALVIRLMAIGGIQIGLMYLFFFRSFAYLTVPEVLLFTILTPLYITLVDELMNRRLHLPLAWWLATALAIAGALVIRWNATGTEAWMGFLLVQCANGCFALGQVAYRRLDLGSTADQVRDFGFFFWGGFVVAVMGALLFADWTMWPQTTLQWGVLLWLGVGASGLGYLGWNSGARRVNTGQLAVMNNMLIPAGIVVNVVVWGQAVDWPRWIIGALMLVTAVFVAGRSSSPLMSQSGQ